MKTEDLLEHNSFLNMTSLVKTALGQSKLSGLSEALKNISQAVNAPGCILWQVAPGAVLDKEAPEGHLFVLAQWFADKRIDVLHDLPLANSVTGNAVLTGKVRMAVKRKSTEQWFTDDDLLITNDIQAACAVPIIFLDDSRGVVTIYKNVPAAFTKQQATQIERLALMIPELYQAIRDRVSLNLLNSLDSLLCKSEHRDPNEPLSKKEIKDVFQGVCNLINDTFQSLETSIFLEDRLKTTGEYELIATTWPWLGGFKKTTYKKGDNGITGWVLSHAKKLKIFDLAYFERDKEAIRAEYEGLTWIDQLDLNSNEVRSAIREKLELRPDDRLPPFSFMAVPIVMGDRVLGVIRCAVVREKPYYFADREVSLLTLVASRIGQYWNNWLNIGELNKAQIQLKESVFVLEQTQIQAFDNLKHQLYGPINQAHARIGLLLKSILPRAESGLADEVIYQELQSSMFAIRGLFAKVRRIAASTGLFEQLARGKPIQVTLKPLKPDALVKMLAETVMDTKLISDPDRDLRFHVDRDSFQVLRSNTINADWELLEQAIMNLLDNAVKYSFSGTEVRIYGGLTRSGRFQITIANEGLPISSEEVAMCIERGWRGRLARLTIGEGSGIGLWIVNNIMKAHGGELIIFPTGGHLTKVCLAFPKS